MRHTRHYTQLQAQAMRPWVSARVRRVRDARAKLVAMGARAEQALAALDPALGGTYPGRETARSTVEVGRALAELEALDIVVRDVDRGLVDFPALRDGEEVYLCWLVDEDHIGFWHGLDAGFAGREPL